MSAKSGSDSSASKFRLHVSPLLASVPAALAAALLGSRLGVQGTLIGAALTALASGVVAQFATFGIERSHAGLKLVIAARRPDGTTTVDDTTPDAAASAPLDGPTSRPDTDQRSIGRRRVHLGVALAGVVVTALATFGVTVGVLTAAEGAAGRSVDGRYASTVQGASGGATKAPDADATSLNATRTPAPAASTGDATPTPTPVSGPTPDAPASPAPTSAATTSSTPATPPPPASTGSAGSTTPAPTASATTTRAQANATQPTA